METGVQFLSTTAPSMEFWSSGFGGRWGQAHLPSDPSGPRTFFRTFDSRVPCVAEEPKAVLGAHSSFIRCLYVLQLLNRNRNVFFSKSALSTLLDSAAVH